jgi:hypothetical protein
MRFSYGHELPCGLFFCCGYHFREMPDLRAGMLRFLAFLSCAVALGRLWIYVCGFVPPISIFGRLRTGKLILPGYDVVFLAPLAVLATSSLIATLGQQLGLSPLLYMPVAAAVSVWCGLALPPRREDWQLTGHHRIAYKFSAALMQGSSSRRGRDSLRST